VLGLPVLPRARGDLSARVGMDYCVSVKFLQQRMGVDESRDLFVEGREHLWRVAWETKRAGS